MNLLDLYERGERSALSETQRRDFIHAAYWHGIHIAKMLGCPETNAADNRVLAFAFLEGFLANRENLSYRRGLCELTEPKYSKRRALPCWFFAALVLVAVWACVVLGGAIMDLLEKLRRVPQRMVRR